MFLAEQTTGSDFSDPKNVEAVQQQMRSAVDQIITNHEGGDDSRAILSQALEQEVQTFMDQGAARGLAANQAAAESAIGETQAIYSNNVANDPASLSEQMALWKPMFSRCMETFSRPRARRLLLMLASL
jgi:hypothetical protein